MQPSTQVSLTLSELQFLYFIAKQERSNASYPSSLLVDDLIDKIGIGVDAIVAKTERDSEMATEVAA
jgi:hypothetical protein